MARNVMMMAAKMNPNPKVGKSVTVVSSEAFVCAGSDADGHHRGDSCFA